MTPAYPARPIALLLCLSLTAGALAGCLGSPGPAVGREPAERVYEKMGFNGTHWPDLQGARITLLTYQAFSSSLFNKHAQAFHNLTNGTVELVREADTGKVLDRAMRERGSPSFDVVYGIDNVLIGKARDAGLFTPYRPVTYERIDPAYRFLPGWEATPVTHGYIAVNVDNRSGLNVTTLDDVRTHAAEFVTEDPRTSTPGLGFLLATVATYGERDDTRYDYIDYWNDLYQGGALVVPSWSIAYENHFTGGYGQWSEGFQGTRALVTSYTTSPAYEMYYEYDRLNGNVLAPKATFHQIQTIGIMQGTKNLAAAQAWVEYTLTDAFQKDAAEKEAIYPVVTGVDVGNVYGGRDPQPGTFVHTGFTADDLARNVDRWVREWKDAYELANA